jgi:hypothetical protein
MRRSQRLNNLLLKDGTAGPKSLEDFVAICLNRVRDFEMVNIVTVLRLMASVPAAPDLVGRREQCVLSLLRLRLLKTIDGFPPSALAISLWAIARMNIKLPAPLVSMFLTRILHVLGDFDPESVVRILWALTKMRTPGDGGSYAAAVSALLAHVDATVDTYEAHEASVLLRMICSSPTAVDLHASLIAKLTVAVALGCDRNQAVPLQNLSLALVKLELTPPLRMPCVAERLHAITPAAVAELSIEGLGGLMQMFVSLRLATSADVRAAWHQRLRSADLLRARPATVSSIVRTVGVLGLADRPALCTDTLSRYLEMRLGQFSDSEVSAMMEGLAQLSDQPHSGPLCALLFQWRPPTVLAHAASGVRILHLCVQLARAGVPIAAEFTNSVAAAVAANRRLTAADVSSVTCAMAELPTPPAERVLLALTRRTVAIIGDFRPHEILNMLGAITKLEQLWAHSQVSAVHCADRSVPISVPCLALQWRSPRCSACAAPPSVFCTLAD